MRELLTALTVLSGLAVPTACVGEDSDAAAADTVRVALEGFRIEVPGALPARATTFVVTNRVTLEHSFRVSRAAGSITAEPTPPIRGLYIRFQERRRQLRPGTVPGRNRGAGS